MFLYAACIWVLVAVNQVCLADQKTPEFHKYQISSFNEHTVFTSDVLNIFFEDLKVFDEATRYKTLTGILPPPSGLTARNDCEGNGCNADRYATLNKREWGTYNRIDKKYLRGEGFWRFSKGGVEEISLGGRTFTIEKDRIKVGWWKSYSYGPESKLSLLWKKEGSLEVIPSFEKTLQAFVEKKKKDIEAEKKRMAEVRATGLEILVESTSLNWVRGRVYPVQVKLLNRTQETISFRMMSCSYDENFSVQNPLLSIYSGKVCLSNYPISHTLRPNGSLSRSLSLKLAPNASLGTHFFQMAFEECRDSLDGHVENKDFLFKAKSAPISFTVREE